MILEIVFLERQTKNVKEFVVQIQPKSHQTQPQIAKEKISNFIALICKLCVYIYVCGTIFSISQSTLLYMLRSSAFDGGVSH